MRFTQNNELLLEGGRDIRYALAGCELIEADSTAAFIADVRQTIFTTEFNRSLQARIDIVDRFPKADIAGSLFSDATLYLSRLPFAEAQAALDNCKLAVTESRADDVYCGISQICYLPLREGLHRRVRPKVARKMILEALTQSM